MRSRFRAPLIAASLALATVSAPALADCLDRPPAARPPDPAEAERLFVEAKQLMKDGQVAQACDLLEQSRTLDPAAGTILQLAYCLELAGKLATSHARYAEALELAQRDGNDRRIELAREHLAALAPRLPRIQVRVSAGAKAQPGLEVRRDGACIDPGTWDKEIPVDPGQHVLAGELDAPVVAVALSELERLRVARVARGELAGELEAP
jgi:hypothetical protein